MCWVICLCVRICTIARAAVASYVLAARPPQTRNHHLLPPLRAAPQACVPMYTALARALLLAYGGYECKEPEPGKFTLAFKCARGGLCALRRPRLP